MRENDRGSDDASMQESPLLLQQQQQQQQHETIVHVLKDGSIHYESNSASVGRGGSSSSSSSANLLPRLEKVSSGPTRASLLLLCGLFIVLEVSKQNVSYAVLHYNGGKYPLDPAGLVVAAELLKLVFAVVMLLRSMPARLAPMSVLFAVPAAMYVVTNNLYLYALTFMHPATWSLLSQSRIVMTAVVYRVVFGREISGLRWAALVALTAGVVLSQLRADLTGISVTPYAAVVCLVSSAVSVGTSIFLERLLKSHPASFYEQQVQLYFFGIVGATFYWAYSSAANAPAGTAAADSSSSDSGSSSSSGLSALNLVPVSGLVRGSLAALQAAAPLVRQLVWASVVLTGVGGIVVAIILKQLDNLAKIFSVALSIVLIGISGAVLFPDSLAGISVPFCAGTALIVLSTIAYTMDRIPQPPCDLCILP